MLRNVLLAAAVAAVFAAAPLYAQDAVVGQMYGSGVHAFFSHDYQKAYNDLSSAIKLGSRDPRVFYFRGLSFEHLGRPEEAVMDFQKGAQLENAGGEGSPEIARSLERIQGSQRATLEKYRMAARVAAVESNVRTNRIPAQTIPAPQGGPIDEPQKPASTGTSKQSGKAIGGAGASDPFAAKTEGAEGKATTKPAPPVKEDEPAEPAADLLPLAPESPASESPAKPEIEKPAKPEADDPFGLSGTKAAPEDKTPVKKPADAEDEKPAPPAKKATAELPDDPF
jgi:hypothetical protein